MSEESSISPQHLSVRVPWHDNGWNGTVCKKPRENGSCMFLPRIQDKKDFGFEEQHADVPLRDLKEDDLPPCVAEKVSFMSADDISKSINHPYANNQNNEKYYGHYLETTLKYPAYSFSTVPYKWMLKDPKTNQSGFAEKYTLNYDVAQEPELGFENTWVQQLNNQRVLLDAFISPIVPNASLVFVYAKNIPYAKGSGRVLLGVGNISKIGQLTEYDYSGEPPFRSLLWERPVYHTIRDHGKDGFLLPYHALFEQYESCAVTEVEEFIAYAPTFEEFSYGSEWVSNDTAIESLLILRDKLRRFEEVLDDANYDNQYRWLDDQLSQLWKMRGPFPGLGAVLTGLKITEGNTLAWQLEKLVRDPDTQDVVDNPWDYIERIFTGEEDFLLEKFKLKISDTLRATWKNFSGDEKQFLYLLSRLNVNNDQVKVVIDQKAAEQVEWLQNPYQLYEQFRLKETNFPFTLVDKAIFSDHKILERFPLPNRCTIDTKLDQRRIRALMVRLLEESALAGHTLQTQNQLITAMEAEPLLPLCNPSARNVEAIIDFLQGELQRIRSDNNDAVYFKLNRFRDIRKTISTFVGKCVARPLNPPLDEDWRKLIDEHFEAIPDDSSESLRLRDEQARKEKASALQVLANNRLSVLVGPAGTGKTELLRLLREQPFVKKGTVLQLAPTGKARVNMGKDARTIAQFLLQLNRYDIKTRRYFTNPSAEQERFDTVIVDESSMITEEQLAALIDSLAGVKRLILVGDFRQLPPIGAGKPFVDIVRHLQQQGNGLAELTTLFGQFAGTHAADSERDRVDVWLGKWFSDDIIKKDQEDVFEFIAADENKDWNNLRLVQWESPKQLEELLDRVVSEELQRLMQSKGRETGSSQKNFDSSLGATFPVENAPDWACYKIGSARSIEDWQILSPVNNNGFGTKAINQAIQRQYRGKTKQKAHSPGKYRKKDGNEIFCSRKMPKPVGEDNIVYGDKVINTSNTPRCNFWPPIYNPNKVPEPNILNYIANGEIGIHNGIYGKWEGTGTRYINITFSSQPEYSYSFWPGQFEENGKIKMELAYAITVHKSQGSRFGVAFFVLPANCPILSRELLYTALTRHEDRIVILHQGNFSDYRRYTSGEHSETVRRLTDLFELPILQEVKRQSYDSNHVQISAKGEFMISKSEVIIANLLYERNVHYTYEKLVTDEKGVSIKPDFTLEDDLGTTYYWEHLGMLSDDNYRSKWKLKEEWYKRNGITEFGQNPDAEFQLILTRDLPNGGIDSKNISELIERLLG